MELFTELNGIAHIRVGKQFVPIVEVLRLLDDLIDHEISAPTETARHTLHRVLLDWHRTGKLPENAE